MRRLVVLSIAVICCFSLPVQGQYCSASSDDCYYEYISDVVVGTINNTGTDCDYYADYTSLSTSMDIGVSYAITVTNGEPDGASQCGIWVDWNQDLDFDDSDEAIAVSGTPGAGPYTATITPPTGASVGDTRMRIRVLWDEDVNACGITDYGEVEDYTITVTSSAAGEIHGTKFHDLNGNGVRDGGEPALGGWEIYIDVNENDQHDTGEPNTITDSSGYYGLLELDAGTYTVAEVLQADWDQTYPGGDGTHSVIVGEDEIVEDVNFGNRDLITGVLYLQAIDDTYVNSDDPNANYGSENGFCSGMNGGSVYRSHLKFDLSTIPQDQVVTSATLEVDNSYISIPAPTLAVFRVTSDMWDESTVTWNKQPPTSGPIPIDQSYIYGDTTTWYVTADVDTDYVIDGFYSVQIRSTNEGLDQHACFWSKDLGIPALAPTLEVEYGPIFGGGTGEANDPYEIWTGEQFNSIGLYPNRWRKHYKLMADISLSAYSGSAYNIIGISDDLFYGSGPFRGVFDGNFHSVSGFSYSTHDDYTGLFGYVYEATIKNLEVVSPSLTDPGFDDMRFVGAIAGCIDGATITGCSVIGGTVEGQDYVGGLVGIVEGGFIANCSSSASISGTSEVGGLIGGKSFLGVPAITDCYAQGSVSGDNYVGGFMGNSSDVGMVNCYSTGLVSGDSNVGGFSGYDVNELPIENVIGCFWDVESSGEPNSAAGTGKTTAQMQDANTFLDAGWDFVGETTNGGSDDWSMPVGGGYPIMWYQLAVAPNLPAFTGGSGTAGDPYLIGTEAELAGIGHNPRLMDKHFRLTSDLDMTGVKYYMIANQPYVFSGTFDGAGHTISNIVLEFPFNIAYCGLIGGLGGNGASIQDLTLIEPNIVSTWGYGVGSLTGINEGGTITNCHAVNTNVMGIRSVGGLVGVNSWYGSISGCSATGDVSGSANAFMKFYSLGGLAGENIYWSEIENSYAKCDVSGDDCVGGLVGTNAIYTTITNSYSQGSVSGTEDYIGGLIGRNLAATGTNYCYSGSVVSGPADGVGGFVGGMGSNPERFTACFWNSDVNPDMNGIGDANDPNVIGESTANMQTESTFTNAGWDFVGEVINGPNDFWDICEGMNYPKVSLQIPLQGDFVCPDGVTFVDFSVLGAAWLSEAGWPNWDPNCDISEPNDNIINELDVKVFTQNWLSGL